MDGSRQTLDAHYARFTDTYRITSVPLVLVTSPDGNIIWRGSCAGPFPRTLTSAVNTQQLNCQPMSSREAEPKRVPQVILQQGRMSSQLSHLLDSEQQALRPPEKRQPPKQGLRLLATAKYDSGTISSHLKSFVRELLQAQPAPYSHLCPTSGRLTDGRGMSLRKFTDGANLGAAVPCKPFVLRRSASQETTSVWVAGCGKVGLGDAAVDHRPRYRWNADEWAAAARPDDFAGSRSKAGTRGRGDNDNLGDNEREDKRGLEAMIGTSACIDSEGVDVHSRCQGTRCSEQVCTLELTTEQMASLENPRLAEARITQGTTVSISDEIRLAQWPWET